MKLHNLKQLEKFDDISEDRIIKHPNCAYILEMDQISQNDKEKKINRKIEKSFYICSCESSECYTICWVCKKECHKDHKSLLIDTNKSSNLICNCGQNNHLPLNTNDSDKKDHSHSLSFQITQNCFYSDLLKYSVSKGFYRLGGNKGKVFCCICVEKCFSKESLKKEELELIPNTNDLWTDKNEYKCECNNHYSPLNFDSNRESCEVYQDVMLNFNFNILESSEKTKLIYQNFFDSVYVAFQTSGNALKFLKQFKTIKFLETYQNFSQNFFHKYFCFSKDFELDSLNLVELKNFLVTEIKKKDIVEESLIYGYAQLLSIFFTIFIKKKCNFNFFNVSSILNMNVFQRKIHIHDCKARFKDFNNAKINELAEIFNSFLQILCNKLDSNFNNPTYHSFEGYLLIFNHIFKFLIKYNLIDDNQKKIFFENVYEISMISNRNRINTKNNKLENIERPEPKGIFF